MGAGAGVIIGSAGLAVGSVIVVVVVFAVIAGASVAVPVIGYLVAAKAMAGPLDSMRIWLLRHNAVVMTVLLLVIGVTLIGKGIGGM
jgi:hypothetical protein